MFNSQTSPTTNFEKHFSKFYPRHYELISKYNVGLKTILHEGFLEPGFYGAFALKCKKLIGRNDFFLTEKKKSLHVTDV